MIRSRTLLTAGSVAQRYFKALSAEHDPRGTVLMERLPRGLRIHAVAEDGTYDAVIGVQSDDPSVAYLAALRLRFPDKFEAFVKSIPQLALVDVWRPWVSHELSVTSLTQSREPLLQTLRRVLRRIAYVTSEDGATLLINSDTRIAVPSEGGLLACLAVYDAHLLALHHIDPRLRDIWVECVDALPELRMSFNQNSMLTTLMLAVFGYTVEYKVTARPTNHVQQHHCLVELITSPTSPRVQIAEFSALKQKAALAGAMDAVLQRYFSSFRVSTATSAVITPEKKNDTFTIAEGATSFLPPSLRSECQLSRMRDAVAAKIGSRPVESCDESYVRVHTVAGVELAFVEVGKSRIDALMKCYDRVLMGALERKVTPTAQGGTSPELLLHDALCKVLGWEIYFDERCVSNSTWIIVVGGSSGGAAKVPMASVSASKKKEAKHVACVHALQWHFSTVYAQHYDTLQPFLVCSGNAKLLSLA